MIENLHICNQATFDSFGVTIENLAKINFIYGTNGSGKTTISNFLRSECKEYSGIGNVTWKQNQEIETLVYNKKFREENFKKDETIPGIFTLGKASIEQLEHIEKLKISLENITNACNRDKESIESLEEGKKQIENALKDYCWVKIKKPLESVFKEAFKGTLHKKEAFSGKILAALNVKDEFDLPELEELKKRAQILFNNEPTLLEKLVFSGETVNEILEICHNTIWEKNIIGKSDIDIAYMIHQMNMGDWVNKGRDYIATDSDVCPFCQQHTITEEFKSKLEGYFDKAFELDRSTVNSLNQAYALLCSDFEQSVFMMLEKEKTNQHSLLDLNLFSSYSEKLSREISINGQLIKEKANELSRKIALNDLMDSVESLFSVIHAANAKIVHHNNIVNNYKEQKEQLISDIWRYAAKSHEDDLNGYIKQIRGKDKGIGHLNSILDKKRDEYRFKNQELQESLLNVTNIESSITAINEMLKLYGFNNFLVGKTEQNKYQIVRSNGEPAQQTLSEGEMTFITFLYFLQLANGAIHEEHVSNDRVLIVDDPISSVDSTVLYVVSSLLKEQIKKTKRGKGNIKQIIILTHNVYFHKEVSYVDHSDNDRDNIGFWILRKNNNVTSIQAYGRKNPIKGSYELLWSELKTKDRLSNISIQNTLRRIIEIYFKTMGGFRDDEILESFGNPQEKEICRSLLCWINDGSHCLPDDLYVENQSYTVERYLEVFKYIFDKLGHINHYNMMMRS